MKLEIGAPSTQLTGQAKRRAPQNSPTHYAHPHYTHDATLHPPAAPLDAGPWTHPHPEVHGPQEHEDAHTVAHPHAASDLSRGVGNGGLLNGGLGLEAVGATDRVEDAWLGLGFRGVRNWGPLVWARTYRAGAGWMVLGMPAMSRKAAAIPKRMTTMACREKEKRRQSGCGEARIV